MSVGTSPDVVTIGEAMLRLGVAAGERLETATRLEVHVGGAEANTAIALAQLGRRVSWISRLPDGPTGRRVARVLLANGVDLTHVRWDRAGRLGLYLVEPATPPNPVRVVYDRQGSSASGMAVGDVPDGVVEQARVVHLSGITLALSSSCRALALDVARRARAAPSLLTVDINYRAKLWEPEVARTWCTRLAEEADLVVMSHEDARDVFGLPEPPAAAARRARDLLGARAVVITAGAEGADWDAIEGSGHAPAVAARVVDRLGAGDAFVAGLIDGLLEDDLEQGVRMGTVLAALALGTAGDHVVTTREEVAGLLNGAGRMVDR